MSCIAILVSQFPSILVLSLARSLSLSRARARARALSALAWAGVCLVYFGDVVEIAPPRRGRRLGYLEEDLDPLDRRYACSRHYPLFRVQGLGFRV